MENLIDDTEQLVTFPDDDTDIAEHCGPAGTDVNSTTVMLMPSSHGGGAQICSVGAGGIVGDTVKFEETRTTSASNRKVITDGFSSEQATSNTSEMKHLQAGDVDYREETAAAAVRKKIEVDGVTAEQNAAAVQVSVGWWD